MVTREEILDLALLSKLSLSDEELDAFTSDMAEIISFADTINNADAADMEFDSINRISNAFREDVVTPSISQAEILKNANGGEDGFFHVKLKG